jgi:hypothetical protein
MSVPEDLRELEEQVFQVRQKQAAIEVGDLDGAAALRGRERQLLADRARREGEWTADMDVEAVIEENRRLHREVERLQALLPQRGTEPDDGNSWTA